MRYLKLIPLAALLAGLVNASAHADIYRWKDAQGNWHYADQPGVPGAEQVKGPTRAAAPNSPAQPAATTTRPVAADAPPPATPAAAQATAQQVQQDVAVAHAEQCKKAQAAYDNAIKARRIYKTNEQGQPEYLDAAAVDAARLAARAEVDVACGS